MQNLFTLLGNLEGGVSADPRDNASAVTCPNTKGLDKRFPDLNIHTNKGITWATFQSYLRDAKFSLEKQRELFLNIDEHVVQDLFLWNGDITFKRIKEILNDSKYGYSSLSQGLIFYIYHCCWGHGNHAAAILFQTALSKITDVPFRFVDGKIGKITIDTFEKYLNNDTTNLKISLFYSILHAERVLRLTKSPDFKHYEFGWITGIHKIVELSYDQAYIDQIRLN